MTPREFRALRRPLAIGLAALALSYPCASQAGAQSVPTQTFIDLRGAGIRGESADSGHAQWSRVFGPSLTLSTSVGTGQGRPMIETTGLAWTQPLDSTFAQMATRGAAVRTSTIDYVNPGSANGAPYFQVTASGGAPISNLSLKDDVVSVQQQTPATLALSYYPTDAAGRAGAALTGTWNRTSGAVTPPATVVPTLTGVTNSPVRDGSLHAYLRFGDSTGSIAGESKAYGYENWIDIHGVNWSFAPGTAALRPGPFEWVQGIDRSLPYLFAKAASGGVLPLATIEYVHDGTLGPVTFMQLTLESPIIRRLSLDGTDVSQTLEYRSGTQTLWQLNEDGSRGRASGFSFDARTGTVTERFGGAPRVAGFGVGNLAPVPEPQTWALMLSGVAMLWVTSRRRLARAEAAFGA